MIITGTCEIAVLSEDGIIDEKTLRKLKSDLTDEFSSILDKMLESHGIQNQQIHSCLVTDLTIDA